MDAHSKARTLHRDISLSNIILYKLPHQQTRVGHLIDWEFGCKIGRTTTRDHILSVSPSLPPRFSSDGCVKGPPAFLSIAASHSNTNHTHCLKDDLESILYVVLYCTLLWLPVTSSRDLYWWLTSFFSISPGKGDGTDYKQLNAAYRTISKGLKTTQSQAILDWLNTTMDLHHHAQGGPNHIGPNPAWDDGKALESMWKKTLEGELPEDDWCENPVPDIVRREQHPLDATYTVGTALTSLFASRNAPFPPPSTVDTMSTAPSESWDVMLPPPSPATTKQAASKSFGTNTGTESLGRTPNKRRGSIRGGAETKRRRTDSHIMAPPPLVPSPSQRLPPPAKRRASRSSTRRPGKP